LGQLEPAIGLVAHAPARDVEPIENMEGREHGIVGRGRRQLGLGEGDCANEARRRGEVAGKPVHAGALAELGELEAVEIERRHAGHAEIA